MQRSANSYLLQVLVKVYNCVVTDFYYFPDVVYAGTQKLARNEFELLQQQQLLDCVRYDSFGRYFTLSKKALQFVQQYFDKRSHKKMVVPLTQGCLYFNRQQNKPANTARCLLFF